MDDVMLRFFLEFAHPISLFVALRRIGNQLLAALKNFARVTKHKYGSNTISASRRTAEPACDCESNLQHFGMNTIGQSKRQLYFNIDYIKWKKCYS
jgi:hypothetical protein